MFDPNGFAAFMTYEENEKQMRRKKQAEGSFTCPDCGRQVAETDACLLNGVRRCRECHEAELVRLQELR